MSIQFIDLQKQQACIRSQLDQAIKDVLDGGQYIMGDVCRILETQLAKYVGVKHCLGCANGTDAIRLALVALNVQAGDMVLTTNFTFFATAEVIAELGAIPLFGAVGADSSGPVPGPAGGAGDSRFLCCRHGDPVGHARGAARSAARLSRGLDHGGCGDRCGRSYPARRLCRHHRCGRGPCD